MSSLETAPVAPQSTPESNPATAAFMDAAIACRADLRPILEPAINQAVEALADKQPTDRQAEAVRASGDWCKFVACAAPGETLPDSLAIYINAAGGNVPTLGYTPGSPLDRESDETVRGVIGRDARISSIRWEHFKANGKDIVGLALKATQETPVYLQLAAFGTSQPNLYAESPLRQSEILARTARLREEVFRQFGISPERATQVVVDSRGRERRQPVTSDEEEARRTQAGRTLQRAVSMLALETAPAAVKHRTPDEQFDAAMRARISAHFGPGHGKVVRVGPTAYSFPPKIVAIFSDGRREYCDDVLESWNTDLHDAVPETPLDTSRLLVRLAHGFYVQQKTYAQALNDAAVKVAEDSCMALLTNHDPKEQPMAPLLYLLHPVGPVYTRNNPQRPNRALAINDSPMMTMIINEKSTLALEQKVQATIERRRQDAYDRIVIPAGCLPEDRLRTPPRKWDIKLAVDKNYPQHGQQVEIPGYSFVGADQADGQYFVRGGVDPYTGSDTIMLAPERITQLAAAYDDIGLHSLAQQLVRSRELSVDKLVSLIRAASVYTFETGQANFERSWTEVNTFSSLKQYVDNDRIRLQCTGSGTLLALSLSMVLPEGTVTQFDGPLLSRTGIHISGLEHRQVILKYNSRNYILDATPALPGRARVTRSTSPQSGIQTLQQLTGDIQRISPEKLRRGLGEVLGSLGELAVSALNFRPAFSAKPHRETAAQLQDERTPTAVTVGEQPITNNISDLLAKPPHDPEREHQRMLDFILTSLDAPNLPRLGKYDPVLSALRATDFVPDQAERFEAREWLEDYLKHQDDPRWLNQRRHFKLPHYPPELLAGLIVLLG